jgi:predicted glycoside hydrolase/deacetylase ChbG (UPF0249 family)
MTQNIRKKFIVTADDYGIRETAEPILRLVEEGKIDRVAVLVHCVSPEQAQALLATGVKIDLHLELINILKSGETVYANALKRIINFAVRYCLGLVTQKRVRGEWEIQIKRFQELFGRLPDGLNSHEHVHYFPPLFRVCVKLAEEHHIPFVRYGRRGQLTQLHHSLTGKVLSLFWRLTRAFFATSDRTTTDYHVSLDWFPDFFAFCQHLPEGSIELVVHPEREEDYRAIEKYL